MPAKLRKSRSRNNSTKLFLNNQEREKQKGKVNAKGKK